MAGGFVFFTKGSFSVKQALLLLRLYKHSPAPVVGKAHTVPPASLLRCSAFLYPLALYREYS
ncbi:hypothetical protein HK27_01980 [Acetobacter orientalis]|nr:hypothetical protein HK27_01980 [Acetobacter orientalis]